MRLFFALTFSLKTKRALGIVRDKIIPYTSKGKFMSDSNFHLTLEFIGEVLESDVYIYENILDELSLDLNTLHSTNLNTFPKKNRVVLWLGVNEEDKLNQLACLIRTQLLKNHIPYENRIYQAHITLGRQIVLNNTNISNSIFIPLEVESIALMHSHRVNDVLIYEPIKQKFLTTRIPK